MFVKGQTNENIWDIWTLLDFKLYTCELIVEKHSKYLSVISCACIDCSNEAIGFKYVSVLETTSTTNWVL